jgi:AcrR family transcriptional regulator
VTTRTSRRTQAERREQTGSALLHAAAELVVEGGVQALTLARVGERAGYSRGIVTHHFGSKKALVDALARASQSGFVPGVVHEPGLERLLYLIDGYVAALGGTRTMSRAFLLLWAEATTSPDLAETFRERDERFRADLRADVSAGIAAGTIRADLDPRDVAVAVLGQLRGIGLQRQLDPAAVPTEQLRGAVTDQWRRALAAPGREEARSAS